MRTSVWIFFCHQLKTYCSTKELLWMLHFKKDFFCIDNLYLFCLYFILMFLQPENRILLWIYRCLFLLILVTPVQGRYHLRWSRYNEVLEVLKSLHLFFCVFLLILLKLYFEWDFLLLNFWKMINSFMVFHHFILIFLMIH